jgi:hypothetical protein
VAGAAAHHGRIIIFNLCNTNRGIARRYAPRARVPIIRVTAGISRCGGSGGIGRRVVNPGRGAAIRIDAIGVRRIGARVTIGRRSAILRTLGLAITCPLASILHPIGQNNIATLINIPT